MGKSTKTKRCAHLLIIIKLSGFRRIKRNVPADAKACLEVEAQGCGNWNIGLVKIDATAVMGEALLKIEACIKTVGTFVVQEGIADKLLGIDAGGKAIVALFVI